MRHLVSLLVLLSLSLLALPAAAQGIGPRIFDIVAPEGRKIQMVDGFTVIRLPDERFGAVLTFSPESAATAWIPLAVLNSGDDTLVIRESGISAHYLDQPLKVYSNEGLIMEQKRRSAEMASYAVESENMSLSDTLAPNRSINRRPGGRPDTRGSREAVNLAKYQVEALRARLFKSAKLAPGELNRGDIRIDLPDARADQPAEFVLRLSFGGQTTDVLYRERLPGVEVGDVLPAGAEATPEPVEATEGPDA